MRKCPADKAITLRIISKAKNELDVLINMSLEELKKITYPEIILGIERMRKGDLEIKPGFDGQYGEIKIFKQSEKRTKQNSLFV